MEHGTEYAIYEERPSGRKFALELVRDENGEPTRIINSKGGWDFFKETFDKNRSGEEEVFTEIKFVPEGEYPLAVAETWETDPDTLTFGFIGPDGTAYGCDFMDHAELLDHLVHELGLEERFNEEDAAKIACPYVENPHLVADDYLAAAGFIKITRPSLFDSGMRDTFYACKFPDEDCEDLLKNVIIRTRPTEAQKATLKRYGYWDKDLYKVWRNLNDPLSI